MKPNSTQVIIHNGSGFTLMELLIAMAIFSVGILGVATMQISATKNNSGAMVYTEASEFAQAQVETIMMMNYADIAPGNTNNNGYTLQWTVNALPGVNGVEITIQAWAPRDSLGNTPRSSITFKRFASM